jgi:NOL1/NOP2/fmu family ribosome biogenesis protein
VGGFMEKENLIKLYGLAFIVGILILMNSVNLAQVEISSYIDGRAIDIEQSIVNYRFLGSIIAILGGLGVIKNINIES